jgi:ketosteroid isomerase-like protein
MPVETHQQVVESELRAAMDAWLAAVRAKDVDRVMAHYAPEVISFYPAAPPSVFRGAASVRKNWEDWFSVLTGSIGYDITDQHITANGDFAYFHSLNHITSTHASGQPDEFWVRVTVGLKKINGKWLTMHEHVSLPIEMGTGKPVKDLLP